MITEAAKQEFLISAISGASKPQIMRHMDEYFDCGEYEIKELMESDEVPNHVFLTSSLLHEKSIAFYLDALNKNY